MSCDLAFEINLFDEFLPSKFSICHGGMPVNYVRIASKISRTAGELPEDVASIESKYASAIKMPTAVDFYDSELKNLEDSFKDNKDNLSQVSDDNYKNALEYVNDRREEKRSGSLTSGSLIFRMTSATEFRPFFRTRHPPKTFTLRYIPATKKGRPGKPGRP